LRVALFITCLNDTLFPQTGRATVEVLERLGCEVDFFEEQTCCGQMHFNAGYHDTARALLRRFVRVFERAEAIVCPSASCAGLVREHYPWLARQDGRSGLEDEVTELGGRVFEFSEFVANELGCVEVGAYFPHRVTYHPSCHSLRVLGVGDAPLRLLRAVEGIDFVELDNAEECCGFGGTFAIKNADTSMAILSDKLRRVLDTDAEVLACADNSCLSHIGGALSRQRSGVSPMHLAEILAHTSHSQ
jgi:L-lactate dehydrogenase complex protein LldE